MNKEDFQKSETIVNLCRSFLLESQNSARCKFMAEKASEEKYCYLEDLLKKTSDKMIAQAKVFYEALETNMDDLGIEIEFDDVYPFRKASLAENFLYSADEAEIARDEIYPEYATTAKEEGFVEIAKKFEFMYQIKDCLYLMMIEIANKMKENKLYKEDKPIKWKCDNCGHEETSKDAWNKCPFCGFEQGHVIVELKDDKNQEKK